MLRCQYGFALVFDALAKKNVPIYLNVISRMEFVDLVFRKTTLQDRQCVH